MNIIIDVNSIPSAVYTESRIACFGFNEKDAEKQNINYEKAVFPFIGIGKSEGMVKVLYNPESKEILGCHIIGPEGTEIIHEVLLAKNSELLPEDITNMIHAHPTLSESIMELMRASENRAIHI